MIPYTVLQDKNASRCVADSTKLIELPDCRPAPDRLRFAENLLQTVSHRQSTNRKLLFTLRGRIAFPSGVHCGRFSGPRRPTSSPVFRFSFPIRPPAGPRTN